jgi:hypothetical protein
MKTQNLLLLILSILLTSTSAFASVPTKTNEKAKLLEELTGKKTEPAPAVAAKTPAVAQPAVAAAPMAVSRKHLNAGFQAYTKKDYITALKHYNTILVKHSKSAEVKSAYLAKAKLYQEMGLIEQAQYNVKLAQELEKKSK